MIKDAAEVVAPGLWFLEAEAGHLGVPLDLASVVTRPGRARTQLRIVRTPDDLFDGQAITKSGWMMADVAGCAV